MYGVPLAEAAVLLHLDTVRMVLLFLGGVVVAVLALCAGKGNSRTHDDSFLYLNIYRKKIDVSYASTTNITHPARRVNGFFTRASTIYLHRPPLVIQYTA